jgi:hypothetical protein
MVGWTLDLDIYSTRFFPPGVAVNHFDGSGNKYEYMIFTVAESHLKERAA